MAGVYVDADDVANSPHEVTRELFQVDLVNGAIARFALDSDGVRRDRQPLETWSLADVVRTVEGT